MTTPETAFWATGSAGWRRVVDSGSDRPTDPSEAWAYITWAVPCAPVSSGTEEVNVARAAHHAAPAAAAIRPRTSSTPSADAGPSP